MTASCLQRALTQLTLAAWYKRKTPVVFTTHCVFSLFGLALFVWSSRICWMICRVIKYHMDKGYGFMGVKLGANWTWIWHGHLDVSFFFQNSPCHWDCGWADNVFFYAVHCQRHLLSLNRVGASGRHFFVGKLSVPLVDSKCLPVSTQDLNDATLEDLGMEILPVFWGQIKKDLNKDWNPEISPLEFYGKSVGSLHLYFVSKSGTENCIIYYCMSQYDYIYNVN